jgi:hypothetical protein
MFGLIFCWILLFVFLSCFMQVGTYRICLLSSFYYHIWSLQGLFSMCIGILFFLATSYLCYHVFICFHTISSMIKQSFTTVSMWRLIVLNSFFCYILVWYMVMYLQYSCIAHLLDFTFIGLSFYISCVLCDKCIVCHWSEDYRNVFVLGPFSLLAAEKTKAKYSTKDQLSCWFRLFL